MTSQFRRLVSIYKALSADKKNLNAIEEYSLILHDEMNEEFVSEMADFHESYVKMNELGRDVLQKVQLSLKDNNLNILKDGKISDSFELYNVEQLYTFLSEEELTAEQQNLAYLFLSNTESIISLNLALRSPSLDIS